MTSISQNSKNFGVQSKNYQFGNYYSQLDTKNQATGAGNGELVAWYEEATAYYNAVVSGLETQPDPAAWQSFVEQMQWAAGQLGYGSPQAWDPMASGQQGFPPAEAAADPFGGQLGAMDNLVYTQETTQIGFIGEERPMDLWSTDITLDVASTSVDVTVEETQDTRFQPPETVLKVVMTDKATGKASVYFLHDPEEIESLKIHTPGAKHVNDLSGRAEVGEFVAGATGQGGGIPQGADIDGDTATYDGVAGQTLDFEPPFGGIGNHVVYSNANISVKNSDEVLVERLGDGGYRVTVTNLDGETTVFTVPEGFYLNINAHAPNVTFKNAPGKGGGDLGSLAAPKGPQRTSPGTDGSDGVPASWENISLNHKGPGEGENGELPATHQRVTSFIEAFTDPQIELEDIPADLLSEIKYGSPPPSQELLQFVALHDNTLKHRIQSGQWQGVRNRLAELLGGALGMDVGLPSASDVEDGKYANPNRTLLLDGVTYEFDDQLGLTNLEESQGAAGTGNSQGEYSAKETEFAELLGMHPSELPQEVLDFMDKPGSYWPRVTNAAGEEVSFQRWLLEVDPKFAEAVAAVVGPYDSEHLKAAHDRLGEVFRKMWQGWGVPEDYFYDDSAPASIHGSAFSMPDGLTLVGLQANTLWPEWDEALLD